MKKYFNEINLDIIIKNIEQKNFKLKKENNYYYYSKKEKNIEQLITIIAEENKIFSIDLASQYYHTIPNLDILESNMQELLEIIEKGIMDNNIIHSLTKGKQLLKSKSGIQLIEEINFQIRVINSNCEKSIILTRE